MDVDRAFGYAKLILDLQNLLQVSKSKKENVVPIVYEIPWDKLVTPRWHYMFNMHRGNLLRMPECTVRNLKLHADTFYCFLRNQLASCPELTTRFATHPEWVNEYVVQISFVLITTFTSSAEENLDVFIEKSKQVLCQMPLFWDKRF